MLNKVMLIGNLGADPEVRYMPSGDTVTNIRLATSRRWKDRQTSEQRESTEWHRVTFFNIGNFKLAEIAGEYLKKGSKVYVEGRIQTRKWQDNTGQDRYSTEIIADQMQMLDSRASGTAEFGQQGGYAAPQANQNQNFQQQPQQTQQQPQQFSQQPSQPQNFQQPQQTQQFNQPAPAAQQNFQAPPQQAQPFNQSTPPPVQQPPLQSPPRQVEQKAAFATPNQPTPTGKPISPAVTDDFDDDIPF